MLSESWCNKRSFSVYSALYTCLLRMGRSSTRNIQVKGFSKYASKPDALKKVLLYMLGCVEMLALIYKNCSLHAVIGERLKKVSKCFSCKIFTDVSVRDLADPKTSAAKNSPRISPATAISIVAYRVSCPTFSNSFSTSQFDEIFWVSRQLLSSSVLIE